MKKIDSGYLLDMLNSIDKIEEFVGNSSFAEFEEDDKTQFAVFHALEVIGEAANKLSDEFVESHPSFPIREAVELRNFLIHGYDMIDIKIVWTTIKDSLPALKKQILSDLG